MPGMCGGRFAAVGAGRVEPSTPRPQLEYQRTLKLSRPLRHTRPRPRDAGETRWAEAGPVGV